MAEQRDAVQFLVTAGLSVRRACALVQIHRSTFHYLAHPPDDTGLLTQIRELAAQHPRYGFRRSSVLINRKEQLNQKRIRRLWQLHRLQVRRVLRKRRRSAPLAQPGAPACLRSDTGAEFVATAVQTWLAQSSVQSLYIEPGKPWQNGKEERFNRTVRDECLKLHLFSSLAEACVRLGAFRHHYNTERPHSQLGYLTPLAFKEAWFEAQAKCRIPNSGT